MENIDEELFRIAVARKEIYQQEVDRYDHLGAWAKFAWRIGGDIATFRRWAAADVLAHARFLAGKEAYQQRLRASAVYCRRDLNPSARQPIF